MGKYLRSTIDSKLIDREKNYVQFGEKIVLSKLFSVDTSTCKSQAFFHAVIVEILFL